MQCPHPARLAALLLGLLPLQLASAPSAAFPGYATQLQGSDSVEATDVADAGDGAVVWVGGFSGDLLLGAGEPNETTLSSSGDSWAYLARYDASGQLVWARAIAGESVFPDAVDATPDGAFVVVGSQEGVATYGAGEANEVTLGSEGVEHLFVASFDAEGRLQWARVAEESSQASPDPRDVVRLPNGDVALTGLYRESLTFDAGGPNETTLSGDNSFEFFLARYTATGALDFALDLDATAQQVGTGVARRADGSLITTGFFEGSITFAAGTPDEVTFDATDDEDDGFVACWSGDGALLAARQVAATSARMSGVACAADGDCFVWGGYFGDVALDAGLPSEIELPDDNAGDDGFVAGYDTSCNASWAERFSLSEEGDLNRVGIEIVTGGVAVFGEMQGAITVDPGGPDEATLPSSSPDDRDLFAARYDASGAFDWAFVDGGPTQTEAAGLAGFVEDGSIVVTGRFIDQISFDYQGPNQTTLFADPQVLFGSAYLTRYDENGLFVPEPGSGGSVLAVLVGLDVLRRRRRPIRV